MTKTVPGVLIGTARVIPDSDVDTDMIFHNRHLHLTDPKEMAKFIFGNLPGREDFPRIVRPGDILVVGHNFGCGSSRQQAVDGLVALGIAAIVGESFGAIYKRNAINAGLPLLECPGILASGIHDGKTVRVNLQTGEIADEAGAQLAQAKPLTQVQWDIYSAGGLLELAKTAQGQ